MRSKLAEMLWESQDSFECIPDPGHGIARSAGNISRLPDEFHLKGLLFLLHWFGGLGRIVFFFAVVVRIVAGVGAGGDDVGVRDTAVAVCVGRYAAWRRMQTNWRSDLQATHLIFDHSNHKPRCLLIELLVPYRRLS